MEEEEEEGATKTSCSSSRAGEGRGRGAGCCEDEREREREGQREDHEGAKPKSFSKKENNMAPFRWFAALSRRGRAAQSAAPSLAKSKRRKLPGFKGFGRSASTTQLVSLGGIPSSSSSAGGGDATVVERDSHEQQEEEEEEDWRIEPVPAVASAVPAETTTTPLPAVKSSSSSSSRLSSLAVAKCWYLATHCALALYPFPAIYLSDRGLSSVEIGTIMALRPFISAVAGSFVFVCALFECLFRAR